ncbi:MAG: trehalose-phosphatase [Candidatus Eisenbacteria bacterium]
MLAIAPDNDGSARRGLPELVWERIARHSHRLLMLDFDGTLAPFVADRMQASLPAESFGALQRILRDTGERVAVISGRPLAEIHALLAGLPIHLVGEHGWEDRMPDGQVRVHEPQGSARWRLAVAGHAARAAGCGAQLERKRASVVLHTRGLNGEGARKLRRVARLWRILATRDGMSLDVTNGGYELRAVARGKHTAVLELLNGAAPGALPVFLGDDVTDEDAFRVLRPAGITIRVGGGERPSAAEWCLDSPDDVAEFLTRWAELPQETR